MAFNKTIDYRIISYQVVEQSETDGLSKVANVNIPQNFEYDPDFLYILIRIVSAGEFYGSNKNADYFPEQELINGYKTFESGNVFEEHRNKEVSQAIGKIISVTWNERMKCVEILKGIDRKIAPSIVRGYEKGYMTDVSMGCKVPYVVCSVCGNKASKRSEFCDHVKFHRNQYLPTGERVFEINYSPKFHDSSVVLSGAERAAKAVMILDQKDFENGTFQKTASVLPNHRPVLSHGELERVASAQSGIHPIYKKSSDESFDKLAALEKEVTGKIVNVVSNTNQYDGPVDQFLNLLTFLGDGRINGSVEKIADTLCELATKNKIPQSHAFETFINVAELMGIKLYPSEVSELAKEMALGSNVDFALSGGGITPTAQTVIKAFDSPALDYLKSNTLPLKSPAAIHTMFEAAPLFKGSLGDNTEDFLGYVNKKTPDYRLPPTAVIDEVLGLIEQLKPKRSAHENLIGRLTAYMGGGDVLMNPSEGAEKDLKIVLAPKGEAGLLHALAFSNYEHARPHIHTCPAGRSIRYLKNLPTKTTRVIKICMSPFGASSELQKVACNMSELRTLVKTASPLDTGDYNAFTDDVLNVFAEHHGLSDEEMTDVLLATLLELTGNKEQSEAIKNERSIPESLVELFVDFLAGNVNEELNKAAADFDAAKISDNFTLDKHASTKNMLSEQVEEDLLLRKVNEYFC